MCVMDISPNVNIRAAKSDLLDTSQISFIEPCSIVGNFNCTKFILKLARKPPPETESFLREC